jgi:hypothetical protein
MLILSEIRLTVAETTTFLLPLDIRWVTVYGILFSR